MKKTYGKPLVSFESFTFSNTIAGSCADAKNSGIHAQGVCSSYGTFHDPKTGCMYVDNGYVVFVAGSCMVSPQNDMWGNLCYHVSTSETKMFAS